MALHVYNTKQIAKAIHIMRQKTNCCKGPDQTREDHQIAFLQTPSHYDCGKPPLIVCEI